MATMQCHLQSRDHRPPHPEERPGLVPGPGIRLEADQIESLIRLAQGGDPDAESELVRLFGDRALLRDIVENALERLFHAVQLKAELSLDDWRRELLHTFARLYHCGPEGEPLDDPGRTLAYVSAFSYVVKYVGLIQGSEIEEGCCPPPALGRSVQRAQSRHSNRADIAFLACMRELSSLPILGAKRRCYRLRQLLREAKVHRPRRVLQNAKSCQN